MENPKSTQNTTCRTLTGPRHVWDPFCSKHSGWHIIHWPLSTTSRGSLKEKWLLHIIQYLQLCSRFNTAKKWLSLWKLFVFNRLQSAQYLVIANHSGHNVNVYMVDPFTTRTEIYEWEMNEPARGAVPSFIFTKIIFCNPFSCSTSDQHVSVCVLYMIPSLPLSCAFAH